MEDGNVISASDFSSPGRIFIQFLVNKCLGGIDSDMSMPHTENMNRIAVTE